MAARTAALPSARIRAIPAWAWLVGIVVLSAAFRIVLARRMVAPWIMVDELLYSELAKSFAAHGRFLVRGVPSHGLGFVYPVLIAPAWRLFSSIPDAYVAAKWINGVLMSLAAVPAYFLARRVVAPGLALLAAFMAVAVPSMVYTGTLMTENVFYPLFLCVALLLVLVLERPTLWNQVALLALCGIAFLARAQAVALVPAALTAPLLFDRRRWRDWRWLYGLLAAGVALVAAYELARGNSVTSALGAYKAATGTHYTVATSFRWLVYHVGELDLYLGVVPFAALLVLPRLPLTRAGRAFAAAAISLSAWLVLEVAVFASSPSVSRIEERNMFYAAPLALIALLVWVELGLPRTRAAAVAVAVAAALVGVVPYSGLINGNATSDTLALLPLWTLQDTVTTLDEVGAVVVLCAAAIGALCLLVPTRWALALPAVVLVWFAAALWSIETNPHGGVHHASLGALFGGIARPDRDWVDRTVGRGADVTELYTGNADKFTVWEIEFFNRSIRDVVNLGVPTPGGLPETTLRQRTDGVLLPHAGYVLTDESVQLAGRVLARDPVKRMVLLRVDGPLRRTGQVTGVYGDSWSGPTATYTRYRCAGGTLAATLQTDRNLFKTAQVVTAEGRSIVVPPDRAVTMTVPLRPHGGRCDVTFRVARTVVPAQVLPGAQDTRPLGVHFSAFRLGS